MVRPGDLTNFDNGITSFGIPVLGGAGMCFTGNYYFVDYVNGADGNTGSASSPKKTLAAAYALCVSGQNDVIFIVSNGAATATQRVDTAFTWAKDCTHLVGICAPSYFSNRAQIAPTGTTTAFATFFTVSGNGCYFANVQWYHGFNTGVASAICMTVTGQRNVFNNCHIAGMGDAASAADAGSRSLKIGGSGAGENVFRTCTIGLDTVSRSAANASVEFVGATPRNVFDDCIFPFQGTAATPLGYIGSAAGCLDRSQIFRHCTFVNNVQSGSTTMSGLGTLPASAGGLLLFKYCTMVGITEFGTDATSRGQCYVDAGTVTAATSSIAVNPT